MPTLTRRQILLAGLAAPGMAGAYKHSAGAHAGVHVDADEPQQRPKRFEEVVGFEVTGLAATYPLAILPLGSLEFHGPHNPLGADSIIITGISERVAARTNALLFPAIKFTQCPAHTAHFIGTMSVRPEVMTTYFADILRNILTLGFRKILILNGHDGNIGPARGAIAQVANERKDAALLFVNWWEFLSGDVMRRMGLFDQSNGGHGHGGPLETSAVAAFRPDLIHLDKAKDMPEPPDLADGAPYFLQKSTTVDWPGYSGKVSEASAEKGKKLVQISEDGIVKLIDNWLKQDQVPGSW